MQACWKHVKWEWTQGCMGRLYWCFVNSEKPFDYINRETLWLKLGKIGVRIWLIVQK